eukprot:3314078-Alexandrium_andersonii.AAC.1
MATFNLLQSPLASERGFGLTAQPHGVLSRPWCVTVVFAQERARFRQVSRLPPAGMDPPPS